MRIIFYYLKSYIAGHFNRNLYLATLLFTAALLGFNYYYDFEDSVIDSYAGNNIRILWFFLAQALPYYVVCGFVYLFTQQKAFIKQKEFWLVSAFGFLLLGIDRGNYFSAPIAESLASNHDAFTYIYKLTGKCLPLVTIVLPLLLFYAFYHRKQIGHFYGIRQKDVNLKPYLVLLALMVPLIAIASYQPDFLKEYPNYKRSGGAPIAAFTGLPEYLFIVGYELAYAFGFFVVELFFRGFLVFGLVHYLGEEVILPMAVAYCVLHFGKPAGEAVSSFFGGYILGVVALKTRNIYGGILVHIGIAMLMEFFAFWHLH